VCSLERMNTLLAGGEVPGLFEDEEYTQLMHAVKTSAQRAGLLLDSDDELYRHFVKQVRGCCYCCCCLLMMIYFWFAHPVQCECTGTHQFTRCVHHESGVA